MLKQAISRRGFISKFFLRIWLFKCKAASGRFAVVPYFCLPFRLILITMGRVFEKRKHKMFARYEKMAKTFTRIGREIAIAVKQNGPNPDTNARLRVVMQNAK